MPFVHRLVREHRLADDVADGENVRHVGAHLVIDRNETAVGDDDTGLVRADLLAVGTAPDRHEDQIVELRLGRRLLAFEADVDRILLSLRRATVLVFEHDSVEARLVHLLPDLHQVAVGALHQAVEHFHDVEAGAERRIHGAHFQPDDAAADHQHALRDRRAVRARRSNRRCADHRGRRAGSPTASRRR